MRAVWRDLPYKNVSIPFTLGGGHNDGLPPFDLDITELSDSLNLSTDSFPAMKTRKGRSPYTALPNPKIVGQRYDKEIIAIDGNTLKRYTGTETDTWIDVGTVTMTSKAKLMDFKTGTQNYTLVVTDGDKKYYSDSVALTTLTGFPATTKFTVHKGRIYALLDNDIKFTALNTLTDWTTVNDAGSIDITNARGIGTAITTYANHVIVWTNYSMHELWGSGPLNYALQDVSLDIGCIADKTVTEVDGKLYWLGRREIFAYAGGSLPTVISDKVKKYLDRVNWDYIDVAVSGASDKYYCLALPIDGSTTNNIMLVYDTQLNIWNIASGNITGLFEFKFYSYCVTSNNKILTMDNAEFVGDDNVLISWYGISKPFNFDNLGEKKSWQELSVIVDLPSGSTMDVSLSTEAEGDNFTLLQSISTDTLIKQDTIIVPLTIAQNANYVRLKLSGTGTVTVHKLEIKQRVIKR